MRIPAIAAAVWLCAPLAVSAQPRDIPGPIYGLTLDTTSGASATVPALRNLSRFPTARVVFDENVPATQYTNFLGAIHPYAYVMGLILDSSAVAQCDSSCYAARTTNYINTLFNRVDVWEVGNEVNGEWLGTTSDVVTKIHNSYRQVKAAGGKTALTLYWNGPPDDGGHSCWESSDHSMLPWAQANVPDDMKQGLDYVLVSFYDQDCGPVSKIATANPQQYWHDNVFVPLQAMFPNSHIGFGENGAHKNSTASLKAIIGAN